MKNLKILFLLFITTQTFAQLQITDDNIKSNISDEDDYVILKEFTQKLKKRKPERIITLNTINSNTFVIDKISEFKHIKEMTVPDDSLKVNFGIEDYKELDALLSPEDLDFLISQKSSATWDFKKIDDVEIIPYVKNKFVPSSIKVFVSKPVYTINKTYALTLYSTRGGGGGIIVYKKANTIWSEHALISPMIY